MAEVIAVMPEAMTVMLAAGFTWHLVILNPVGKALPHGNAPLKEMAIRRRLMRPRSVILYANGSDAGVRITL